MAQYYIFDIARTILMIIATIIFIRVYYRRRDLVLWLYGYFAATISQVFRLAILESNDLFELISLSFSALSLILIIVAVSKEYFQTFSKKSELQQIPAIMFIFFMSPELTFNLGINLIIVFLLFITLFFIIKIYITKKTPTHAFLIFVLICGLLNVITNTLKDGGLPGTEELYQISSTIMTTVLLFTGLVAFIEERIASSEKGYRLAYNRAEFYKDLFVHDINNILQNLEFSLEIITQKSEKYKEELNINEIVNLAKKQVNRGAELGVNVRKLSDLESGKVKNTSLQVYEILEQAIKYVKTEFQKKKLIINIESKENPEEVCANQVLYDVFRILLNNAIRYNDNPEIEVLIKISKQREDGINYARIEFRDNGIGMPDKMKEGIFYKIYEKPKSHKRIGLGLLLVKEVIHSISGVIWAEDCVKGDHEKGTNVILLIPETH